MGNFLKARRSHLGMSQRAFALALTEVGVPADASRISRIESGQADPRFSDILVMCEVLECTPNDVAGIIDAPPTDVSRHITDATERAIQALTELKGIVEA